MKIFILRHGQAELPLISDEARNLTPKGRMDTQRMISTALPDLQSVQQLWASPLVRAQQTAQIAQEFFSGLSIQTTDMLVPEANVQSTYLWLEKLQSRFPVGVPQSVLLVSHQPLVGVLLNQLCGQQGDYYPMDTSSLAAISIDVIAPSMGELLWLRHI